ncbi:unnamed protein product, partial [Staurois parvus]
TLLTSLEVFPSVARGKVSAPQAVTPSYTREYLAALLQDLFCTYLFLCSRDVPPAASPATSQADAGICLPDFHSLRCQEVRGRNGGKFKMSKSVIIVSNHFTYILSLVLCPVPCLHFDCSFCLETEKRPWRPKSVPLGQKQF